jgi:hypothetical protein
MLYSEELWLSVCIHECKKRHRSAADILLPAGGFFSGSKGTMALIPY